MAIIVNNHSIAISVLITLVSFSKINSQAPIKGGVQANFHGNSQSNAGKCLKIIKKV